MNQAFIILINFLTGTASLMFGVNLMSRSLEKANSRVMEKIISIFAGKVIYAFAAGAAITALVQSSTAVTVLTVSFVNSGLLKLNQAVGIILGANIGTTITAQLLSLNLSGMAIPMLLTALAARLVFKRPSIKALCSATIGFSFIFIGIGILNSGVPYIKESPLAYQLFERYGNNLPVALITGMVATMLVHSSSATVGLTIVLFNSGLIGFEAAVGLTLGDNIGTCITAQLASLGGSTAGRRTAWAHTIYNIAGVLIALILFTPFLKAVRVFTYDILGHDNSKLIANTHTLFNILGAAVFLPITGLYVRFITWLVPGKK